MIKALSHWDLDGIASIINLWNAIKNKNNFEYKLTSYNNLEKNLNNLTKEKYQVLWVTDLNFSEEQIKKLTFKSKDSNIFYIDHHVYDYDIQDIIKDSKNIFTRINRKYCGSLNTFLFLSSLSKNKKSFWNDNKEKLVELNKLVNVYDLWQKENPLFFDKAIPLNDLFWEYGFEKFFKKFRNGYDLDDEDIETSENKKKERMEYLKDSYENFSVKNEDTKSLFVLNPNKKFTNDFTLYYPDYEFYVIHKDIENDMFNFSIRINRDNEFTISNLIMELKNRNIEVSAGGHDKSGGMSVHKNNIDEFMDAINNIFGEYINA